MQIEGTAAIVTGAASGLGLATAQRLTDRGAYVVLLDLPQSDGAAAVEKLGSTATFVPGDVREPDSAAAAVRAARETGRPLRILVNCAGIGPAKRVVGRQGAQPLEEFRRVIDINLVGTFNVLRLAAEQMIAEEPDGEERGVVVNTASVAAFDGQIGQAAYSASKGGIVGLTLPVARELAQHLIRVVTIAPGQFETPLLASLPDDVRESLGRQAPHPSRLGRPDEYAAMVEHIVTNPMLNGETIRLDAAMRMAPR